VYVAAVDGNGGMGTIDNPDDMIGDDVFAAALALTEQGGAQAAPQTSSCSATAAGSAKRPGWASIFLVASALALIRWRRRLRILLAAGIAFGASGCVTVHPWQREHHAQRIMKFAPDPDEDELDQHMLEAREGSAGGYGSAGGGCGCN
jgi:hypothetical protein